MATKKEAAPKAAPKEKAEKKAFNFSATIEEGDKEVVINYQFVQTRFKLNKQVIEVADLFDENGEAKESATEIFSHLVVIDSGLIQKID
jgi:hypothetical protein